MTRKYFCKSKVKTSQLMTRTRNRCCTVAVPSPSPGRSVYTGIGSVLLCSILFIAPTYLPVRLFVRCLLANYHHHHHHPSPSPESRLAIYILTLHPRSSK